MAITHQSRINKNKLRKRKTSIETNQQEINTISKTIGVYNTTNWDTAFSWGDHSTVGYLTTVNIGDINATGTPNNTTFLRGDGTWNTPPITSPAGSNRYIQFNDSGVFGASSNLQFVSGDLQVSNSITITGNGSKSHDFFNDYGTTNGTYNIARFTRFASGVGNAGFFARYAVSGGSPIYTELYAPGAIDFAIATYNGGLVQNIYIDASTERVGIGTTTPSQKLDVNGKIKATSINFSGLPTSASGLSSGDVWNDSGTLKIV